MISGIPPVPLQVIYFNVIATDSCRFEALTVNGQEICGVDGPEGLVAAEGVISWRKGRYEFDPPGIEG